MPGCGRNSKSFDPELPGLGPFVSSSRHSPSSRWSVCYVFHTVIQFCQANPLAVSTRRLPASLEDCSYRAKAIRISPQLADTQPRPSRSGSAQSTTSQSSSAGFQGRRKHEPLPEGKPPSKHPTHRHDRTPETIKHTQDTRRKRALSLLPQSFQRTSGSANSRPPLELGSPRSRVQSNSTDADSARDSRPEGPKAQRALLRSFRHRRSTRKSCQCLIIS